jgi:hypothetical protein
VSQKKIRKAVAAGLFSLALSLAGFADVQAAGTADRPALQEQPAAEFPELPSSGKKCRIDDEFHFTYEFTKKPRLGTAILRVLIFDQDGKRSTGFTVIGRSDMPSMAGAHDSGDQEFKLNKKGDYLLPVNVVMPGEWEIKLTFKRGETTVVRGAFRFDV